MLFNSLSGNNNASGVVIDDKSRQWFGASVHSSGPDGIIVVSWNNSDFFLNENSSSRYSKGLRYF